MIARLRLLLGRGAAARAAPTRRPVEVVVSLLVSMNLVLLVFNLVPAFPLDGGRIARAIAWKMTGDRHRATRFAARIGIGFGWLLIGFGIYLAVWGEAEFDGIWFAALGWMLSASARGALAQTAFTERIDGRDGGRHHGRRAGDDPGRPAGRARVRGLLPPLPGLALVRGRRGRRPLRGPRPPRAVEHAALHEGTVPAGAQRRRRPPMTTSPPTRRSRPCSAPSRCAGSAR